MSVAALLLDSRGALAQSSGGAAGYGSLVPDPGGVIDLPAGFQYRILSEEGSTLSNGAPFPKAPDGMAALRGPGNTAVLVRNHELKGARQPSVEGTAPYDAAAPGGTTGIVVNLEDRTKVREYVISSGTVSNCAGGATPWGTWLTCEEDRSTNHGYVFEVDPNEPENELSRTPIRDMGFFSHEAAGVDPKTGIVYLTEDDHRGDLPDDPNRERIAGSRVSFLYRYIPNDASRRPGALQQGGRLQVMTLKRLNFNADLAKPKKRFKVFWRDVNPEEPHENAEKLGAARFNRLEGAYFSGGAFWFDDTAGGEMRLGQIFRYFPKKESLELFYEGTQVNKIERPDNILVTPFGDLWFAEDGSGENRIMGITPEGRVYKFARNRVPVPGGKPGQVSELAGPTFSPDGKTFFVNIQNPGMTLAIWGPFRSQSATRRRGMANAAPPASLAPQVSGELIEGAEKHGMSSLEAAAFERLGMSLT